MPQENGEDSKSTPAKASESESYVVHIEAKKVQSFLFAVPKLSAIVGANVLLGEVFHGSLSSTNNGERSFDTNDESLPGLARKHGAQLPNGLTIDLPTGDSDPLGVKEDCDSPADAAKFGVLSRDGGHFSAVFPSAENAKNFVLDAKSLIATKTPGLRVNIELSSISRSQDADPWCETRTEEIPQFDSRGHAVPGISPLDFPQAVKDKLSAHGPASFHQKRASEQQTFSMETAARLAATDRIQKAKRDAQGPQPSDLTSRLSKKLEERLKCEVKFLDEFQEIAGGPGRDLAVIHVDGNAVSDRVLALCEETKDKDFFQQAAVKERLFFDIRSAFRKSLLIALKRLTTSSGALAVDGKRTEVATSPPPVKSVKAPFRLLMLGGDDLVLVCAAEHALRFVADLERALQVLRKCRHDSVKGFTFGAGVFIANPSFPFHRSHELAEELASSAKQLHRQRKDPTNPSSGASTVDWLVCTESWHDSVKSIRQEHYVLEENGTGRTLLLSSKPYFVSEKEGCKLEARSYLTVKSLEKMLEESQKTAQGVKERESPRSGLRAFASEVVKGFHVGKLAAATLRTNTLDALQSVMSKTGAAPTPWAYVLTSKDTKYFSTQVLDFLELVELSRAEKPEESDPVDILTEKSNAQ